MAERVRDVHGQRRRVGPDLVTTPRPGTSTFPRKRRRATTTAATGTGTTSSRPASSASTRRRCEKVWHFQIIHHDIWDWDNPTFPILADIEVDGEPAQDRRPAHEAGLRLRLRPASRESPSGRSRSARSRRRTCRGNGRHRRSPSPPSPPAFDRQGFSEDDLIDFTPELKQRARSRPSHPSGWDPSSPRRRWRTLRTEPAGRSPCRARSGARNWEGGALDPETGMLYVGSQTNASILQLVPGGDDSDMDYIFGFARAQVARGVPIVKPPWGRITALDLSDGTLAWTVPNGDTPEGGSRTARHRSGAGCRGRGRSRARGSWSRERSCWPVKAHPETPSSGHSTRRPARRSPRSSSRTRRWACR